MSLNWNRVMMINIPERLRDMVKWGSKEEAELVKDLMRLENKYGKSPKYSEESINETEKHSE